jgi:hypothetical protein
MDLATARNLVEPFVSEDETRPHLCAPFGTRARDRLWLAGTDGHRAALVLCEDAEKEMREGTPQVRHVIPETAELVGSLCYRDLEAARMIPRKWNAYVTIHKNGATLTASANKGSGKKATSVRLFDGAPVPWKLELGEIKEPTGIAICYLLDAIDFVGTAAIDVWRERDPLAPWMFLPPGATLETTGRIALVMPVRL